MNKCLHCGHEGDDVGFKFCRDEVACWARWDTAHGFKDTAAQNEMRGREPRIADTARVADEIDELLSKSPQIMKGKQYPILNNPHMCQESTGCNDCQIWLDWKDAHPQLNV